MKYLPKEIHELIKWSKNKCDIKCSECLLEEYDLCRELRPVANDVRMCIEFDNKINKK